MGAEEFVPAGRPELGTLERASAGCRGCDLYRRASRTVFGAGGTDARVMLVGEQPGDREDREGLPFVGPAGQLLDQSLERAGLDRAGLYVTNAVKHFKWEPRGKLRLHKKPSAREVAACRPWLEAEIAAVQPRVIVCLGATAATALFDSGFRVTQQRGKVFDGPAGSSIVPTVHPSAILRAGDAAAREAQLEQFVADLAVAARLVDDR